MKSFLSKIFASYIYSKLKRESKNAVFYQEKVLKSLLHHAVNTDFGKDHHFHTITGYDDFIQRVPVRDYEEIKVYIEKARNGEPNVLWDGIPIYFSKTSGTTSGAKYIPITRDSIANHIDSARNALLCYIHETGKTGFVKGKMIFLQGSPLLDEICGIKTGRLSGIVAHHIPSYLLKNRMPSYKVNCIEDWETKVEAITEETAVEDMTLISGIPPWIQMYFEVLKKKTGKKTIAEIFPNFSLLVYGGVNFKPYQKNIEQVIGKKIDQIEVYPASEGFLAFQDSQNEEGMLLNVNSGIFFEFIKADEAHSKDAKRIYLKDVKLGVNYAVVVSNNAGLWAYNLGDTIKFVSTKPHRIIVSGRIKHFTSAFGEHVIAEEVEDAANYAIEQLVIDLHEFHVSPMVNPGNNQLPFHEWFIEMDKKGVDLALISKTLDEYMQKRNPYYKDLRQGNILQELKIKEIRHSGFNDYMKSIGKLGGQNKLPRLSNDRSIADSLEAFILKHE